MAVRRIAFVLSLSILLTLAATVAGLYAPFDTRPPLAEAQNVPVLRWGSRGEAVRTLQWRLQQWGYYTGAIDGVYGAKTYDAVVRFQRQNGVYPVDGVVGAATWRALGLLNAVSGGGQSAPVSAPAASYVSTNDQLELLARVVAAEAEGEPFAGQVGVAAVVLNRVQHPGFPNTLTGVIYQPHAFESVSNGLIWRRTPSEEAIRAAQSALNGWDPTYGSIFFWNPSKPVSSWIWSRPIVVRIGNHVFAR